MGTVAHTDHIMKLFVLAALVACASSRPRFLVIPLDDMQDLELMDVMQNFPMYRMPGLARQARAAQEEDSYQSAPHFLEPRDTQPTLEDTEPSDGTQTIQSFSLPGTRLAQAVSSCLGLSRAVSGCLAFILPMAGKQYSNYLLNKYIHP